MLAPSPIQDARHLLDDLQNEEETALAFHLAAGHLNRLDTYAELGLGKLGLFHFVHTAFRPKRMIGFDNCEDRAFVQAREIRARQLAEENKAVGTKITTFDFDSHGKEAEAFLAKTMPEIDLLVVDGDHSEAGCMADVVMWLPFVCRGGLMMLHDLSIPGVGAVHKRLLNFTSLDFVAQLGGHIGWGWSIWTPRSTLRVTVSG